ncbi:sulfotransferase domain-containing protein [Rhizobium straminoryzae]|uniref:sulfotransferase domain-containing protein n=1 Tax=Rhizobium straminoryzae TaxID=1387186 RepID=UPI00163D65D5|nr:sulfotransferase domain-containing protein [Rhizobium straminoryzae]
MTGHSAERVGLFIAGVQKAGTTSLDVYLRSHPSLAGARVKEPHFFDDESLDWSNPPIERLHALYPPPVTGTLRFEATPISSFWPHALERIQRYNATAKIILLLRDPIERAWSQWSMQLDRGTETLSFPEAIEAGPRRLISEPLGRAWRDHSYVERGFYLYQIRRVLSLFPASQVLFLESRGLAADPVGTMARIAGFLDLAPFPPVSSLRERQNPVPDLAPQPKDILRLRDLFVADARATVAVTGIDARHWPTLAADPVAAFLASRRTETMGGP